MKAARAALLAAAPLAGLCWFSLVLAHVALSAAAPLGVLRDPVLGWGARLALLGREAAALAFAGALAAAAAAGTAALERRGPRWIWPARIARLLGASGLAFAYAASWAAFWVGGRFLDARGLDFYLGNAGIVLGYAVETHPLALGLLPFAALAAGGAAVFGAPRLAARFGPAGRGRWAAALAASVAACALAGTAGELSRSGDGTETTDPETGLRLSYDQYYEMRRDFRAGPLTHAFLGSDRARELCDDPVVGSTSVVEEPPRPPRSAAAHAAGVERSAVKTWDVVLVLVDSLRSDQLKAYGAARDVMPAVNALAAEGRVYTDMVSNGTLTDLAAPCPNTSHYPLRSRKVGALRDFAGYPRVLLYDLLKAFGYRTAFAASNNEFWGETVHLLWSRELDFFLTAGMMIPPEGPAAVSNRAPHVDDARTTDEALAWLGTVAADQPFFLYLNYQNAHIPYVTPDGYPRPFGRKPAFTPAFGSIAPERIQPSLDAYADSLHYVDSQIRRIVERLKGAGRWDRTIFVLSADHGQAFGEHGMGGHGGQPFEEITRVPLVIRAPGLPAGLDGTPAELIDLAPTICGLLGIPPHPSFQGVDLRDAGLPRDRPRFVLSQTALARAYAILKDGYKLIFDADLGRFMLYHLASDPGERRDLARERPELVRELGRLLEGWRKAQTGYYADRERWTRAYPPRIR